MPEGKMEKSNVEKFPTVDRLFDTVQQTTIESENVLSMLSHKLDALRNSGIKEKIERAKSGEETFKELELWIGKMRRVMLGRVFQNSTDPEKGAEYEQAVRDARAYHANLKAVLEDAKELSDSLDE